MQDTPLPDITFHPVMTHSSQLRSLGNAVYAEQEQSEACSTTSAITEIEEVVAKIGSLPSNGKFVCDVEVCGGQTFARQAELRRYHTTLHAANKPKFRCQVPVCRRRINGPSAAFHRKDKLTAHI
jgi:hypothetical protein